MSEIRVAYQGEPGAYSEAAIRQCISNGMFSTLSQTPNVVPKPCPTFEEAFQSVQKGLSDFALLPYENSLGGSIHINYDLLLRYNLHIISELSFEVNHCLLAVPGTSLTDLREVVSHPQALAQCEEFLRSLQLSARPLQDTAGAARAVARGQLPPSSAAIASELAAEVYGLEILKKKIQDQSSNFTRFLLLSRKSLIPDSMIHPLNQVFVTSLVFVLQQDLPGALFRALSVFALRDIDMTKIESRPARMLSKFFGHEASSKLAFSDSDSSKFKYLFYVDICVHVKSETGVNALRHLSEIAPLIRILGNLY